MAVPVDIEQIDPHHQPALRAWWEVGSAATADRPGTPWPAWEHSQVALASDNPERGVSLVAAIDGRSMVGAGLVSRPLADNLHTAVVDVYVHPERRREGVGTALLAEVEAVAAGDGRTTLQGEGYVPPGGTGPAEPFARRHGYDVVHRESIKELLTTDYLGRREALVSTVSAAAADHRVVTYDTVCPDEHVGSFGRLLGMLMSELPLGDLDVEASEWTAERIRAAEQRQVAIGRHCLTALAVASDGTVAGVSDLRIDDAETSHGSVGITLVDPAHRGHRLGLALKMAALDLALASYPHLVALDTSNAEVNTHMSAVNEAMGYRSIETLLDLQKKR